MIRRSQYSALATAALLFQAGSAAAQEAAEHDSGDEVELESGAETVVVRGHSIGESPGFRTSIKLDETEGETSSIAEVLSRSVGVNVRSLGGLGGFASISIRGASPTHTAVFIDGVPISKLGVASQDLGSFEIGSFAQLDVYRGTAPMEFGSATMGGAINLRTFAGTRNDHAAHLSFGGGSFGARHMRASLQDAQANPSYQVGLGYRAARGDYQFFNDNGTSLLAEDDAFETRLNNGFEQLHGVARGRYRWSETTMELGSRTSFKLQGIPGLGSVQSEETSLSSLAELIDLQVMRSRASQVLRGNAYVFVDRQDYSDVEGEVGLGNQHNRYQTLSSSVAGHMRQLLSESHLLELRAELGVERFRSEDLMDSMGESPKTFRGNAGVGIGDEMALGSRTFVTPVLRLDYQYTDPGQGWSTIVVGSEAHEARTEMFASPRLSSRILLGELTLKASVGRFHRVPTSGELFGDRGVVVGNPGLRAETGYSSDLGFVLPFSKRLGAFDQIYAQLAGFASYHEDAIVLMPSSGRAALAQNLGDAILFGAESALNFRLWRRLEIVSNYTLVDSRQRNTLTSYEGKRLPMRPRHELYLRTLVHQALWSRQAALWADLSYTSGNFLDAANRSEVPQRVLLGAGIKLRLNSHLGLGLEAKNLSNARVETITLDPPPRADLSEVPRAVSDFLGYPLPGRAFYATLDSSF